MAWAEEGASGAVETPTWAIPSRPSRPEGEPGGEVGRVSRGPLLSRMTRLPGHGSLLTGLQCQPLNQSPALWTWFMD